MISVLFSLYKFQTWYPSSSLVVSFPDPTLKRERVWGPDPTSREEKGSGEFGPFHRLWGCAPTQLCQSKISDLIGQQGCMGASQQFNLYSKAMVPMASESYDCAKAAIWLKRSNSFPGPRIVSIFTRPFLPPNWRLKFRLCPEFSIY